MNYPKALTEAALQGDPAAQAVLHDWLLEHGASEHVAREAFARRPLFALEVWIFLEGCGSGCGSGSGSGIGRGSGRGRGRGRGSGRGIGIGSGRGSGIGSGIGSGRGSGIGSGRGIGSGIGRGRGRGSAGATIMEIDKCYLVHCGDWHTFVGRVVAQVGPGTYRLEKVSKIAETNNGDCWEKLAAGDVKLRRAATYKHYETHAVLPLVIIAFEWTGDLPQEW